MKLELGDHSATRRHGDGLDTFQRRIGETAEIVDLVEISPMTWSNLL
jgi:hypothetical protein